MAAVARRSFVVDGDHILLESSRDHILPHILTPSRSARRRTRPPSSRGRNRDGTEGRNRAGAERRNRDATEKGQRRNGGGEQRDGQQQQQHRAGWLLFYGTAHPQSLCVWRQSCVCVPVGPHGGGGHCAGREQAAGRDARERTNEERTKQKQNKERERDSAPPLAPQRARARAHMAVIRCVCG